jgi:hypothetical protein
MSASEIADNPTHYGIRLLQALSLVWDVRGPSEHVRDSGPAGLS